VTAARPDHRPGAAWLAASLLAGMLALLGLAGAQGDGAAEVQLEPRVFEIARQLRCPTCVSESVGDSNAAISIEMRNQIRAQLREGRSEGEILAFFQERYGDWILLEPPRRGIHLLVWGLPGVALIAGLGGLGLLMARWTRNSRRFATEERPSDDDLARVRAALDPEESS
jgi:cytochrome c-type biogenesis protein CcmH